MATRSTIAVKLPDGSFKQVYCHWDGYLEYNGVLLQQRYNTASLAEELVSLGDISSLSRSIHPEGPHTFDNRESGVTTFYGRDRGEKNVDTKVFADEDEFRRDRMKESYNYVFEDGKWYVDGKLLEEQLQNVSQEYTESALS